MTGHSILRLAIALAYIAFGVYGIVSEDANAEHWRILYRIAVFTLAFQSMIRFLEGL